MWLIFHIRLFISDYTSYTKIEKDKISSWISEQNIVFNIYRATLNTANIDSILEQKNRILKEQFNCFMKTLSNSTNSISEFDVNHCNLSEIGLIRENGFDLMIQKAKAHNLIDNVHIIRSNDCIDYKSFDFTLTFEGLEYLESLNQENINSKNIFVAFNFTEELQKIFDNQIKLYIERLNYTYTRVSSSTTSTHKKIDDEIISLIRSARIVIADFTGQRNSVYFEAGFAMGLNIPVIWTCKESEWKELSFDTRQYPHILWKDADDLAKQISNKIKAMP